MLDWIMTAMAAFAFILAGINVAYGLFSDGPHRSMILMRGLICGYIGVIYTAYLAHLFPEPIWMRHMMRGAIFTVLLLFMLDTISMWRGNDPT